MARLYADENFPLPVVTVLRRLGHDIVTIQDIICTKDLDFRGQAQRIHEAIRTYESLHGQLIRVYRPAL
jgi:Domain of unknown function (DUF5615)